MSLSRTFVGLVASLILLLTALPVQAQGANDEEVQAIIEGILETEYKQKKYSDVLEKLEVAKVVCEGDACSAQVRAELSVAIGMAHANLGNAAEAKDSFSEALADDPEATLPKKYATKKAQAAWNAAKKTRKAASKRGCRGSFGGGDGPRGWLSAEAYHCYKQAKQNEAQKDYKQCSADASASIELERRIDSRALLARCLEGQDRWGDAIAEYEELARDAPRARQFRTGRSAASRAAMLQRRMPVLILKPPDDVADLVVKLDGTTLPTEVLDVEMPVDPGEHRIEAQGTANDLPLTFEEEVLLEPGKTLTLPIRLAQGPPKWATRNELKCMLGAKSPEEFAKCINKRESKSGDMNYRVGLEMSGYHDSMDVDVLTPSVSFSIEHVTDGWGVGASFLVDVVTAASVDILATASPSWTEVRFAPSINGHKKWDPVDVGLAASLSHEPDYLSGTVGANLAVELVQKTVTPSLGYQYSHDVNARHDTPWDVFKLDVDRHALSAGLGLVATKATFLQFSFTFVYEDGDLSKPYRHVPMFAPQVAPAVPAGLVIEAVNLFREPERPLEQLPVERYRYGIAGAIAHRFTDSTLRLSERAYLDDWGVKATTTDARFMYDVVKQFRLWPHLRFHAQTGADFYKLAYVVQTDPASGLRTLPAIRTGDRELGPLISLAFGGGAHLDLGARRQWGISIAADAIYSRFLNHLFVKERWGGFGALNVEAEFE